MDAVIDGIQHNLGAIAGGAIVIGLIQVCDIVPSLLSIGINLSHLQLSASRGSIVPNSSSYGPKVIRVKINIYSNFAKLSLAKLTTHTYPF